MSPVVKQALVRLENAMIQRSSRVGTIRVSVGDVNLLMTELARLKAELARLGVKP